MEVSRALLPAIKLHTNVDELLLIDLDAAEGKEPIKPDILKELTKSCLVPITYAGGICSVGQIREMLLSGADKIVINTSSFSNVNLITEAANVFGTQCIVGGVDYKYCDKSGGYVCYSHCGLNKNNTYLIEQVKNLQNAGVGELLITSIEHDGLMEGFDYSTVKLISKLSQVPIIASGGCGGYHHMHQAFQSGADAIAAEVFFVH